MWPLIALAALVALGIALEVLGLIDWRAALEWARGYPAGWGLAAALILLQIAMFTFALPGSTIVWVAAVLYPAPMATLILTAGGTAGALAAYVFARRLGRVSTVQAREQRLYRVLEAQGDFLTLCALRVLPGVPHSLINYTAALLRLGLPRFLTATALGFAVKSFLYSTAIGQVVESATYSDIIRTETLGPLAAIALILLFGRVVRGRWLRSRD